jgi:regulator of sirC expression with transglutaminase-like and TPR domain
LRASIKQELDSILPAPGQKFDFTATVLKLSKAADPELNYAWCSSEIDRMAQEVKPAITSAKTPEEKIEAMNRYLFRQLNFRFDEAANAYMLRRRVTTGRVDMTNYESFDRVLNNRRGICVSLSLLYLMLSDKLGLPIYPVFMPRHVYVRYDDGKKRINIETTSGGVAPDNAYYRKKFRVTADSAIYGKKMPQYRILGAYLNNIGVYFQTQGRFADAIICHKKDLEINPDLPNSYSNLGAAYLEAGDVAAATAALEKSMKLAPYDTDNLLNLGFAYQSSGRLE